MRKSRLSWSKQQRLIELFVAGSTARTSASLVGVNKTTVRKLDSSKVKWKLTRVTLVVDAKESVVGVLQEKYLYLAF